MKKSDDRLCDFLTLAGVCFAFAGMGMAMTQHFMLALLCLLICGLCDAFDGVLARRRERSEKMQTFGAVLDALAKAVSFGVLPAVITLQMARNLFSAVAGLVYLLAVLVRLAGEAARLLHGERDWRSSAGLPAEWSAILYPLAVLAVRLLKNDWQRYISPAVLLVLAVFYLLPLHVRILYVSIIIM